MYIHLPELVFHIVDLSLLDSQTWFQFFLDVALLFRSSFVSIIVQQSCSHHFKNQTKNTCVLCDTRCRLLYDRFSSQNVVLFNTNDGAL
jgi:hypothetical protein